MICSASPRRREARCGEPMMTAVVIEEEVDDTETWVEMDDLGDRPRDRGTDRPGPLWIGAADRALSVERSRLMACNNEAFLRPAARWKGETLPTRYPGTMAAKLLNPGAPHHDRSPCLFRPRCRRVCRGHVAACPIRTIAGRHADVGPLRCKYATDRGDARQRCRLDRQLGDRPLSRSPARGALVSHIAPRARSGGTMVRTMGKLEPVSVLGSCDRRPADTRRGDIADALLEVRRDRNPRQSGAIHHGRAGLEADDRRIMSGSGRAPCAS
jgi:hypothetical protein